MFGLLLFLLIVDGLLLIAVVLLQAGQGGGLAAMGGGASTDSFMGSRQAVTILTKATWWCGGIFLSLSLVLAGLSSRGARPQSILEGQIQVPTPVAPLPLNLQQAPPAGTTAPGSGTQAPAPAPATPPEAELNPAYVLLEDGAWFPGATRRSFSPTSGEVVFTTNLTGYQEVFTDPSYTGQIVTMTAPMIGNYGVNPEDLESGKPQVQGILVRELSREYSNWRASGSLDEWLAGKDIPVVESVDTRRLTRYLREKGAMRGIVVEGEKPTDAVRTRLGKSPRMEGLDLASGASCSAERSVGPSTARHHVVAYDFGMKENILRMFVSLDCRVTVVPAKTPAARVKELQPDGLFLSNGPGDPAAVTYALPVIRELTKSGLPTFGICLGHQLLGLAFGGETTKLPYGHRGGNHPVRETDTGRVLITSQNHGFAVRGTTKDVTGAKELEVTHVNLNDGSVEGLKHRTLPTFAVQYHPEASPGPHDARKHFHQFVQALDSQ